MWTGHTLTPLVGKEAEEADIAARERGHTRLRGTSGNPIGDDGAIRPSPCNRGRDCYRDAECRPCALARYD